MIDEPMETPEHHQEEPKRKSPYRQLASAIILVLSVFLLMQRLPTHPAVAKGATIGQVCTMKTTPEQTGADMYYWQDKTGRAPWNFCADMHHAEPSIFGGWAWTVTIIRAKDKSGVDHSYFGIFTSREDAERFIEAQPYIARQP